jgi:hypothetical protein
MQEIMAKRKPEKFFSMRDLAIPTTGCGCPEDNGIPPLASLSKRIGRPRAQPRTGYSEFCFDRLSLRR